MIIKFRIPIKIKNTIRTRALLSFVLILVLLPISQFARTSAQQTKPATPDNDVILKAMQDELTRSVNGLQLKGLEKPYFIEYAITDLEGFSITGEFGALIGSGGGHSRLGQVQVRVGNYDFDSEFGGPGGYQTNVVLEDDYNAIRHDLWLATDAAYKSSAEQFERKRAFVKNREDDDKIPDFSHQEPTTDFAPRQALKVDRAKWEKLVREWSGIMRQFPEIQESGVNMNVNIANRYLVNSEGTKTRQPISLVSIRAYAATQAMDGSSIDNTVSIDARSVDQLPQPEEIANRIRQMATDLTNLRKAPALNVNYDGPVLFTGQASTEMFAQLLAPELSSYRAGLAEQRPNTASVLSDRLNRPVLPSHLSVVDDPTQQAIGNQPLMGSYKVDDQGVPSRRVSLIERGVLKDLLMSRRPRKEIQQSNGHGRASLFGRTSAHISNLFVQSANGKSYDELKQELIAQCQTQNLDYGILIKKLETAGNYVPRNTLTPPILAYKVYVKDGHEELIRGATIGEINTRSLKQMIAIGNDNYVENLASSTPSSVIAPSVLLEELELKKPVGAKQKPAIITHPYFNKP